MSTSEPAEKYSYMWTTHQDHWFLVERKKAKYTIWGFDGKKVLSIIIEKENDYQYVVNKMLEHKNKIYTFKEFASKYG